MATVTPSDVIDGVAVVAPDIHGDERGIFIETYRRSWFPGGREMIQGNRGDRRQGAIVGLHYHLHQADYWYVPFGQARVVLHDLRTGSPTDGATLTVDLGSAPGTPGVDHDHRGIYIPPGVAHGFAALTDMTITYLVDGYYNPADELGVAWDDPAIGADWGVTDPVVSARDQSNPRRSEIEPAWQPHHRLRTA
ncbi:MAG: dTDP-4-dehydrorhamnose 3,5-epimerase family protein [Microthrixaceae bacterium]|nr:dTDP-4-dehydrorhamnose 3,5-epimerase family protein [Acidimicrobiales bacterium]MCB9403107.1 dTDP-4-dehydrorhamnose 3,5-epimerase family protein [Microthrixaceae bacterium]